MPQTNTINNSDTENTEAEATNLDRAGAGDVGGAVGQQKRRLGSPQEDVGRVASMTQPVDSERHDPTYNAEGQDADQLGNETGLNGDTPAAGDVDPGSTKSAEETGQDGDPTRPGKSHGKLWNQ